MVKRQSKWTSPVQTFQKSCVYVTENGESLAYWHTPLPGLGELQYKTPIQKKWDSPGGWEHITQAFLATPCKRT